MMAQDEAESPREPINYGRFIKQFQSDIMTSIRYLERGTSGGVMVSKLD